MLPGRIRKMSKLLKSEFPFIIMGSGGHSSVLLAVLKDANCLVASFVVENGYQGLARFTDYPLVTEDIFEKNWKPDECRIINGVGPKPFTSRHLDIFNKWTQKGFNFVNVIHPTANIFCDVPENSDIQIMASSTVQVDVILGKSVVINTGAIVDHTCNIGNGVFIGPNATVCGNVDIKENSFIGAGAIILPDIIIGPDVIIGAGCVVDHDILQGVATNR